MAVAEHDQGLLAPVSLEVMACARLLGDMLGLRVRLAVLGQGVATVAALAARATGSAVMAVEVPGLNVFHGETYRRVLAALLPAWEARVVVAAHTTSGLDWLPGMAARLGAACVTGVEGAAAIDGSLRLRRSTHFGKVVEEIEPRAWPLALTVQPGAFPAEPTRPVPTGPLELVAVDGPACLSRVVSWGGEAEPDQALGQARVVVAAGRGVGKAENLEMVRRLAGRFSGAALAGSRPVCDLGWLGYRHQVGITGATVAPRLYIACGISGARQHTMGMQGSGFIVAISNDPRAAIFNLADVCIVEDLTQFIPAFLEQGQ